MSFIGWDEVGRVDRLDSECVVTEFFHFIIPLWPRRTSLYTFRTRAGEASQFEIPRVGRSVMLGYLRTPLWLAALVLAIPAMFDFERWKLVLAIAIGLAAIAVVLTFFAGKLAPAERERRARLRRVAGIGAPPELIPHQMLEDIREELADAWFREHELDWRDSIHRGVASETLVVLAEYYRTPQLLIRAHTNLIDAEGN
jgi:hypothetical protein